MSRIAKNSAENSRQSRKSWLVRTQCAAAIR